MKRWLFTPPKMGDVRKGPRVKLPIMRSEEERNKLVMENQGLVRSAAGCFARKDKELFEELVSYGQLGLIKAGDHFDESKGYKFSTYAGAWIFQAITRGLLEIRQFIHIPYNHKQDFPELYEQEKEKFFVNQFPKSQFGIDGDQHEFDVADKEREYGWDPDEVNDVVLLLKGLEKRDRNILKLRYGLDGNYPHTLREVGKKLGMSRERARQLQDRALTRMMYLIDRRSKHENDNKRRRNSKPRIRA